MQEQNDPEDLPKDKPQKTEKPKKLTREQVGELTAEKKPIILSA